MRGMGLVSLIGAKYIEVRIVHNNMEIQFSNYKQKMNLLNARIIAIRGTKALIAECETSLMNGFLAQEEKLCELDNKKTNLAWDLYMVERTAYDVASDELEQLHQQFVSESSQSSEEYEQHE